MRMLSPADFRQPHEHAEQFDRLVHQIRETLAVAVPFSNDHSSFIVGPPITHPSHFFGHEREVRHLFNLLKKQPLQHAAIIGPRRSGKTSLLLYLKNITTTPPSELRSGQRSDWLSARERYQWIFVDFLDMRMSRQEGLLRYLLTSLDLPVPHPCNLDSFSDSVSSHLHRPTVILLDEISVALQHYTELDNFFWWNLRALATNPVGGNLAFILADRESPIQLTRDSDHGSPFLNIIGYTAMLTPLTEFEARELVASSPIRFPAQDVDWILAQSGRWPILLQALCRERLLAIENGESGNTWREQGIRQMEPFRHLLG